MSHDVPVHLICGIVTECVPLHTHVCDCHMTCLPICLCMCVSVPGASLLASEYLPDSRGDGKGMARVCDGSDRPLQVSSGTLT